MISCNRKGAGDQKLLAAHSARYLLIDISPGIKQPLLQPVQPYEIQNRWIAGESILPGFGTITG